MIAAYQSPKLRPCTTVLALQRRIDQLAAEHAARAPAEAWAATNAALAVWDARELVAASESATCPTSPASPARRSHDRRQFDRKPRARRRCHV
jgi:hypothetical protein